MTQLDWEFIGSAAGWALTISGLLLVLDGVYNLICWGMYRKIRRKKKTSRRCGNTNREDDSLHCHNKRESA